MRFEEQMFPDDFLTFSSLQHGFKTQQIRTPVNPCWRVDKMKHCQRHYGPRRWLLWPIILFCVFANNWTFYSLSVAIKLWLRKGSKLGIHCWEKEIWFDRLFRLRVENNSKFDSQMLWILITGVTRVTGIDQNLLWFTENPKKINYWMSDCVWPKKKC